MQGNRTQRRSYGTGSLEKRQNADGSESWVAVWSERGRKRKKTLGRVGELSEKQANQRMAELRGTTGGTRADGEKLTVAEVSRRYLLAPPRGGRPRKPSTIENVESETRAHLEPFFGERPIAAMMPTTSPTSSPRSPPRSSRPRRSAM